MPDDSVIMGDLSDVQQPNFALVPVLQRLHSEGDTGRLQVRPPRGSYGAVYFEQGEIVHATHATVKGIDAFITIVTWNVALNSFRPKILAKDYTIDFPFFELLTMLAQSEQALKERGASSAGVAPVARVTNTPQTNQPDPRTTGALATGSPVPKSFLNELTTLFIDIKGPIADIIMEDVSYDLGYELGDLPSSELRAFYKGLLKEIPDVEAKRRFVASLKALEKKY